MDELEARVAILEMKVEDIYGSISFSQRDTARKLGVSESTLIRWRKCGIITPIPGTTRYSLESIKNLNK